jgi:TRAP-type C4-dicarboxylate transport system permease small subunit
MRAVAILKKISDGIDSLITRAVFISVVLMIISITLQIVFRVFFEALTWTEEVSRYLLVWSTFLGATLAYKRSMHISVTFIVNLFRNKIRKLIVVLSIISSMVFFITIIVFGFKYMVMQASQVSAALRIPMRWVYTVIPVSFTVMTIHSITAIFQELFSRGGVK